MAAGYKGRFGGFIDSGHGVSVAFCGIRYSGRALCLEPHGYDYGATFEFDGRHYSVSANTPSQLKTALKAALSDLRAGHGVTPLPGYDKSVMLDKYVLLTPYRAGF